MTAGLPFIPAPAYGPLATPQVTKVDRANPWDVAADLFTPPPPYATDVKLWAQDKLGEFLWSKQEEVANSMITERYTAVQSCHDAGKSFVASRLVTHWIDTHPEGSAFVVSTAPTNAQVQNILWREVLRAHTKGDFVGRIVSAGYPQWKLKNGEPIGYGRKPADYSDSAFQGIHAEYVLVIIDEANGIDKSLWDAVDALLTNENARVVAIGNPDNPTSHFADVCKPGSGWNVIRIDGLRTPNFTREAVEWLDCRLCREAGSTKPLLQRIMEEEDIPYSEEVVPDALRPMLLAPVWVEERLHRWVGKVEPHQSVSAQASQSALFTSKVRGLFPDSASEGVIPLGWIEQAMDRWRDWKENPLMPTGRRIVAVDVADEGPDSTALAIRKGNIVTEIRRYPNTDTMGTVGFTTAALSEPHSFAVVDSIGVGAGVVSRLRELEQPVRAFNAAKSAKGKKDKTGEFTFPNLRSWAWWHLRELLDPMNGHKIMLPDSETLKADLAAPKWKVMSGGGIQVEPKDEIRKRLGRSPDEGDSVVMAFITDSYTPDSSSESDEPVDWYTGTTQHEAPEPDGMDNLPFDGAAELDKWLRSADQDGDVTQW